MRILHINQSDIAGGAAIAAFRLHQALLAEKKDSFMLVGAKKSNSLRVDETPRSRLIERNLERVTYRLGLNGLNYQTKKNISSHAFYKQADILNFHNLHTGPFNYLSLPHLTSKKPAIFTLHDMWAFTGHCAYSYDCDRWEIGCGRCPSLKSYPPVKRDNTKLEWNLKCWSYEHSNIEIVTPSKWLTQKAKASMLKNLPIHHIPNGIDTDKYAPLHSEECRRILGISRDKHVLMFGAENLSDNRKGGDLLLKILTSLPSHVKEMCVLLTLGRKQSQVSVSSGMDSIELGYLSNDRLKSAAYSAADLFLFPTRADNLPLVLQESMACGTPTVSFNIGGVPDLVRPNETGYLAIPEDIHDFCKGILTLLEDASLRQRMSQRCREIILSEYSIQLQVTRYLSIYEDMLKSNYL